MNSCPPDSEQITSWQLLMVALSVLVLALLAATTFWQPDPESAKIIDYVDNMLCLVFIADFFGRFVFAERKLRFVLTNWIDLVSSIPLWPGLRVGRTVRVVRVLRLLRAFRSTKLLTSFVFRNRAKSAFASMALISFIVWFFAAIAILHFEVVPEANIKTAEDALWWAFVTITTVGYGDKYPVTTGGRLCAAVLMTVGVGMFGTFTAYVASLFFETESADKAVTLEMLQAEIQELKTMVTNTNARQIEREDSAVLAGSGE